MKAILFVAISVLALQVKANLTGTVYEQNSNQKKILFTYVSETTSEAGLDKVHSFYKDLDGNVVIDENSVLKGSQVVKVEIDQKQVEQKGVIEVKDGKVYFTKTADGKTSTKDEKLADTFVVSANFQRFIHDHWDAISAGKTVSFRYGVWDRQETVGFEIFKTGESKMGDQPVLNLKMKPSSFIIAALVKPILFTYAADGSHLLARNGRVEPKKKDGSTYKDLDAEMVYKY